MPSTVFTVFHSCGIRSVFSYVVAALPPAVPRSISWANTSVGRIWSSSLTPSLRSTRAALKSHQKPSSGGLGGSYSEVNNMYSRSPSPNLRRHSAQNRYASSVEFGGYSESPLTLPQEAQRSSLSSGTLFTELVDAGFRLWRSGPRLLSLSSG